MARDFALAFYHSPAWRRNRAAYLELPVDSSGHVLRQGDDGSLYWVDEYGQRVEAGGESVVPPMMCERCFGRGELVPAKVVHHIVWLTPENIGDPHVTLSYDNFQRLCQDCHAAVHSSGTESRTRFDGDGNLIWREDDA